MAEVKQTRSGKQPLSDADAESILNELASVFLSHVATAASTPESSNGGVRNESDCAEPDIPKHRDMYRVLVEQVPAVVFIAYLDGGLSEAYVSPQIESTLGFRQEEWLEDPIRWYWHIHPDDRLRWSIDAAQMFITGKPLTAAYRVLARDGRIVWFKCEAKLVRRQDGRPWFIHGVGFDISDLKQTEESLQQRTSALQNLSAHILRLQDEERRRIARELHDSLGQYLTALKINLDIMGKPGTPAGDALFLEVQKLADDCMNETRTISHLLHPPVLDELGFTAATRWYVEGFAKRSDVKVTLDLPPNLERMSDAIEMTLFRVLQETLTNIHRHSGSPSAEIRFAIVGNEASLHIRDHGRGLPSGLVENFQKTGRGTGIGLSGMSERVNELGGRLELCSDSGGTLIRVTVPVSFK